MSERRIYMAYSFLGHTITQLVIDELEAFYNILSEESGI